MAARMPKRASQSKSPAAKKNKTVYKCTSCGTVFPAQQGYFLKSSSSLFECNDGYVPICKTCLENYYTKTLLPAFENDEHRAIEAMCGICDWYYSDSVFDMAKKAEAASRGSAVLSSTYAGKRTLKQVHGSTLVDTIMERKIQKSKIMNELEAKGLDPDPDSNKDEIDPELIDMFGPGYTPEEYRYMKEQYEDWVDRYDINTKALETCIISVCVAQLNLRRAQQNNDNKAANDAMKTFQELLNTAKLSPRQTKEDQLGESETFGTLIKLWEKDAPIPDPDPELSDVDGIQSKISTFFFGHLAKMFHINNDYTEQYEKNIAEYTAQPPKYDDVDGDDSSIDIDKTFENVIRENEPPSEKEGD
jgi:hypothetical protein